MQKIATDAGGSNGGARSGSEELTFAGRSRRETAVKFVVSGGSFNDGGECSEDRWAGQIEGQLVTTGCKSLADGGSIAMEPSLVS